MFDMITENIHFQIHSPPQESQTAPEPAARASQGQSVGQAFLPHFRGPTNASGRPKSQHPKAKTWESK